MQIVDFYNSISSSPAAFINLELFKRQKFAELIGVPFKKQEEALNLLCNPYPMQLLYGGAAGGGKSFLAWTWLVFSAMAYPETSWFFAREQLKDARLFGLQSYFEVCDVYGIERNGKQAVFQFNGQDNFLRCKNGSMIYLLELKHKPSDVQYQYLGSRLFTGGAIEEAGQINFDAFETLWVRCGRYHNQRYKIAPKLLLLANPTKNFLYHDFYLPHTKQVLPAPKKYIQAFVYDNPFQTDTYITSLKELKDPIRRARLYEGNWHYHSDELTLFSYENLQALFSSEYIKGKGQKFMAVDRAGQGKDKSILIVAYGKRIVEVIEEDKSTHDSLCQLIKEVAERHEIPMFNIIVDAGGLSDVHDSLGCKGFLGGSRASTPIYPNLRTECAYYLAKLVKNGELFIDLKIPATRDVIVEQFEVIKRAKLDADDGKMYINKKDAQKALLGGKSPDYADAFIMLMFFELKKKRKLYYKIDDYSDFISDKYKNNVKINGLNSNDKIFLPKLIEESNNLRKNNTSLYSIIQLCENGKIYGLVSLLNSSAKALYHLNCFCFENIDLFVEKITNFFDQQTDIIVYRKGSKLSNAKWHDLKRKKLIKVMQEKGLNVRTAGVMNTRRQFVARQIIGDLYSKKLQFSVEILPNAKPLIEDKLNTFGTPEGMKDYTSGGYLTDCEDYLIVQLFN